MALRNKFVCPGLERLENYIPTHLTVRSSGSGHSVHYNISNTRFIRPVAVTP
ncbi:unnamed protein product [Dovyalis caffra]|uniref:Uncharacterized protein n=1 Tax=Dovyalis caffra TaxID=77055 RepID=A0AAV1SAV6_9ROSI|nr:unnamed protein product [Dovyalis caffra]